MNHHFHKLSLKAKHIAMRNSPASHAGRRNIIHFAEKMGFVYFGSVNQHADDHHIIRGLTVSSSHKDDNYAVGSLDGYDISLVNRADTVPDEKSILRMHTWLVFEIGLHQGIDIPHIFLEPQAQRKRSFTKLTAQSHMQIVPLGTLEPYSDEFLGRYHVFASPSHFIETERYFSSSVTRTLAAHFWPLAVEVSEGSLYLYASNQVVNEHLLETMLRNGIWLATKLDEAAKNL